MAGKSVPFRNPAGHAGLLENLLSLLNSLAGFFESRLALVAVEGKTALIHFIILAACLIGALVCLGCGYVFVVVGVVVGIAHLFGISWVWIAFVAGGTHFLLALLCLLIARMKATAPVFRASATELRKDREWLKKFDQANQPTK